MTTQTNRRPTLPAATDEALEQELNACQEGIVDAQAALRRATELARRCDLPAFALVDALRDLDRRLRDADRVADDAIDALRRLIDGDVCRECGAPRG